MADVIVLTETWFSANTCRDVRGYTGFHTYRADKSGGGVSVLVRDCYTSTHVANFSVCHAYYEFSVVMISHSNNCIVIIIGVCRPPDKSKIPKFTIKLNEIFSSTSQSDHVFIVNLLDLTAIENSFINNCHSNSLIPQINKPTRKEITIWVFSIIIYMVKSAARYIQWYVCIRITDHYPIFTIVPIKCPQKRIRVKFRDHSRQNIAINLK